MSSILQPVVPAVVRLLSHKVSKRQYEAVVLAQVLEGSTGVVWVVAVSPDGAFLATAGQDCVLRVWQLTASKSKHTRSSWVYSSGSSSSREEVAGSHQGSQNTSQAGADEAGSSQQQPPHQAVPAGEEAVEQQQQDPGSSLQGATSHNALPSASTGQHGQQQETPSELHPNAQQQQQDHEQARLPQQQPHPPDPHPPVVEFGAYYSRTPVRQYSGHSEDILDLSWSSSGGFLLSASLDKSVRLWALSQPGCLRVFEHSDFVTSVQFHPKDAGCFVSGEGGLGAGITVHDEPRGV